MNMRRCLASLLAAVLLLPSPALADWMLAETKHFRIYSDGSERELAEQARLLERFDWLMRKMTGAPGDREMPPLDIYLVKSARALHAIAELPPDTAGFYSAGAAGTAAFSMRINDTNKTGLKVLLHEYAHHFMAFHFPYPYPSWYAEGFADYFSTANVKTNRMTLGEADRNQAVWLGTGTWIDTEQLMTGEAWRTTGTARAMFYAQSWLAVHYLLRDPERSRQLTRYLTGIRDGENPKTLFEASFGVDYATFGRQLLAYAKGRTATSTILEVREGAIPEPAIRMSALPASAERLLLPYAALRTGAGAEKAEALIAEIRADAARYPADEFAALVLAGVEAEHGDPLTARTLLQPMLAAKPDDAELNYLMGRSYMRSADDDAGAQPQHLAAARRHFARAFKARPKHYQTLYNYVLVASDPHSPANRDVLAEARNLAPQVAEIAVNFAQLLVATGEFERAEAVLMGLVMNPHHPPSQYIRALLDMARSKQADMTVLELLAGS